MALALTIVVAVIAFSAAAALIAACVILFRPSVRRATKHERQSNQRDVEAWIARTKGDEHVRRTRGE